MSKSVDNGRLLQLTQTKLEGITETADTISPYKDSSPLNPKLSGSKKVFSYVKKFLTETESLVTSYKFFVEINNEKNATDEKLNNQAKSLYYFYEDCRDYLNKNYDKLSTYVTNVSFSDFQFGREQIKTGFYLENYLQSNHTGYDINITFDYKFKDGMDFNILEYFNRVRSTYVYNGMYLPARYQYRPEILIYMFDQNDILRATFVFNDCFLVNYNNINLDYSSNEIVKFETVWASDRCSVLTTNISKTQTFSTL